MYAALRNQIYNWIFQLRGPEQGGIILVQRRVFILPSGQGLLFAVVLLLMLTGSVNYNLSLGYILTFLLGAMGINTMLQTFRNLANLRVFPGRAYAVFAGEPARFAVCLENAGRQDRYSVGLTRDRRIANYVDVAAGQTATVCVDVPTSKRGLLRPGRLRLFTRFPLGFYYAWAYADLDTSCTVYPRPAEAGLPIPEQAFQHGSGAEHGLGHDDFAGLRQYHPGDSPRHIAWKAAARDQGLLTKQFSGQANAELILDWEHLPARFDTEQRLSQLVRWVIDAHGSSLSYGLRLPGVVIDPASGDAHRDRCLEALALFGLDDPHV